MDEIDYRLIMYALTELANHTDEEYLADHARNLALEIGESTGIDPAEAPKSLPYNTSV